MGTKRLDVNKTRRRDTETGAPHRGHSGINPFPVSRLHQRDVIWFEVAIAMKTSTPIVFVFVFRELAAVAGVYRFTGAIRLNRLKAAARWKEI